MSILHRALLLSGFIFLLLLVSIAVENFTNGSFPANNLLDAFAYMLAGAKLADIADKLEEKDRT